MPPVTTALIVANIAVYLLQSLVPALLISFLVASWIQYVAEKYPTCVLIGFCMYFVILHSLPNPQRARNLLIQ